MSEKILNSDLEQDIAAQNLYELLACDYLPDDKKDELLELLTDAIWESFFRNEAPGMISPEDMEKLASVMGDDELDKDDILSLAAEFLSVYYPDGLEVLAQKGITLREKLLFGRAEYMANAYAGCDESLCLIDDAVKAAEQGRGFDSINLLFSAEKASGLDDGEIISRRAGFLDGLRDMEALLEYLK